MIYKKKSVFFIYLKDIESFIGNFIYLAGKKHKIVSSE